LNVADAGLTRDGFLGGRLHVWQPRKGYRAATDPVLLAAACPAVAGQSVLELGCGVGVAGLCLMSRMPGLSVTGLERQEEYAHLARRNAQENALPFEVIEGDIARPPPALLARSFDHVILNPPFFRAGHGTAASNSAREVAFREDLPLSGWIDAGLKRLVPGGWLTLIHLADRLGDILAAFGDRAGDVRILPVAPRAGRPASRLIVRARKTGRGPLVLLSPFVLHDGASHLRDGDDFAAAARAVLRRGEAIRVFGETSADSDQSEHGAKGDEGGGL
jgi:tRNA1(Val) A37 N6-methylase TrmN6